MKVHESNGGGGKMLTRRWIWCSLLVAVAMTTAGCGGSGAEVETPTAGAVPKAAALMLEADVLSANVTATTDDETILEYTESVDTRTGASFVESGSTTVRLQDGRLFTRAAGSGERWIEVDDVTRERVVAELTSSTGAIGSKLVDSSPAIGYLRSLTEVEDVTTIGRDAVSGKATTHYLAQSLFEGSVTPVEVWVADDGTISRIRYLFANSSSEVVEVSVEFVDALYLEIPLLTADAIADPAPTTEVIEPATTAVSPTTEVVEVETTFPEVVPGTGVSPEDVADALNGAGPESVGFGCLEDFDGNVASATCAPLPTDEELTAVCGEFWTLVAALEARAGQAVYELAAAGLAAAAAERVRNDAPSWYFENDPTVGVYVLKSESTGQPYAINHSADIAAAWDAAPELGVGDRTYRLGEAHQALRAYCGTRDLPDGYLDMIAWDVAPAATRWTGVDPGSFPYAEGSEGPRVAEIQSLLMAIGTSAFVPIDVGASGADGFFGPATTQAVMDFQSFYADEGLQATGVVDELTYTYLQSWGTCVSCSDD